MTGQRKERLKAAGVDVDEALGRVLGNEALLERLLAKFAKRIPGFGASIIK